jgi:hypothetical protein
MPLRNESPWHKLTVEQVEVWDVSGGGTVPEYHVDHPTECDQLKYGQTCWFDGEFFEYDHDDLPTEPGVYRARVWMEGPFYPGDDYDGGNEWEPYPDSGEASDAAPSS